MLENRCPLQDEIRKRLIRIMKYRSYSYSMLSKEININWRTINTFLASNKEIRIQPFMKVVNFVETKEREINANEFRL